MLQTQTVTVYQLLMYYSNILTTLAFETFVKGRMASKSLISACGYFYTVHDPIGVSQIKPTFTLI